MPHSQPIPINPFPATSDIEGIDVAGFDNPHSLFERIALEAAKPAQSVVHYLNIHVANTAWHQPKLKGILQAADLVYCDGAGIVLGSKLLGRPLPVRLAAADWFLDMLAHFAEKNLSVYLLGGEPGVSEAALAVINEKVPNHTVIGHHHGFIVNAPETEQRVFNEINRLKPDIMIVGFGTPLQETWVEEHRRKLQVSTIYPLGAILDFVSGRVSRCPRWMGEAGLEWLYRLLMEPRRMLGRYVIGNPWFLGRILMQVAAARAQSVMAGAAWASNAKPAVSK